MNLRWLWKILKFVSFECLQNALNLCAFLKIVSYMVWNHETLFLPQISIPLTYSMGGRGPNFAKIFTLNRLMYS